MVAEVVTYIAGDGQTVLLSDPPGTKFVKGRSGAYMPPIQMVEDVAPLQPGATLREVRIRPRDVMIPVIIKAADRHALRLALRSLLAKLDPMRGTGTLRITSLDGASRDLYCRLSNSGEPSEGTIGMSGGATGFGGDWMRLKLLFRAVDPYWYASAATSTSYALTAASTFFPFFPIVLLADAIFLGATINNPGDVDAWPVWTITGPTASIVLRNLTSGEIIDLGALTLAVTETVTIDTRPGYKSVVDSAGANRFGSLTTASSLWPLLPGDNSVRIEIGAATVNTTATLAYFPRFLTI